MSQVTNFTYDALEVGQKATFSTAVEERHIQLFAAVSGDRNPVHLDAEYAATTMFKERIAHGMFTGALISAAIACEMPGPGSILRSAGTYPSSRNGSASPNPSVANRTSPCHHGSSSAAPMAAAMNGPVHGVATKAASSPVENALARPPSRVIDSDGSS